MPALFVIANLPDSTQLGKAWVLFSAGLIQLFVPNSPLAPAIEEYVAYYLLEIQKKMSSDLIQSWKSVRTTISGDQTIASERYIPNLRQESMEKPRVFKKDESLDGLLEEWNAFMKSSIDVEPVKYLLQAGEECR